MSSLASYILAALLTLMFFTFNGSKATFIATPNCPITSCNNGLEFHYPFWKIDDSTSDRYCGYPGFGLTCSNSTKPILTLPNNDSYYIQDINFTQYTITLIDIDAFNQTCPRARHTVSVGLLPLDYSPLDVNLTFYFNCSFYADTPNALPIACLEFPINDTRKSYVFIEGEEPDGVEWSESCEENVVVAVNGTEVVIENIGDLNGAFGRAMNNGFVLNWTMAKECGACEVNGGYCGYDNIAGEVVCFCEDGEVGNASNGLCKKKDQNYTLCNQPFNCGNLRNLSYPFWSSPDRPQHCGRSGFELLNCTNPSQPPHIAIENLDFHVISITNSDPLHTMTLSRSDLYSTPCTSNLVNTSLDYDKFSYVQTVRNLTLYYGCDPQADQSVPNNFTCEIANSTRKVSYYVDDSLSRVVDLPNRNSCVTKILVPIFWVGFNELPENATEEVEDVLRQGFQVEYAASWELCRECMSSKGTCVSNETSDSFLCLCGDQVYDTSCTIHHGSKFNWKLKIVIGLCSVIGTIAVLCFIYFLRKRRNRNRYGPSPSYASRSIFSTSYFRSNDTEKGSAYLGVHVFTYKELEQATNYFDSSKELGDGGFGTVYYGKVRDGRSVAVKRLYETNSKRVEQFMNEIEILARLRHQNLVLLYGCTSRHSRELLLVYEYVPNGTLADHLHGGKAKPGALPWHTRISIAVETASALSYLHASEIIHRDVKTTNILLDNNFCVKVADFGLSRFFSTDATHISTAPQGTPGYVDPDYNQSYQLTAKSDVYSFGVVLVELISSLPAVDITRHRQEINLSNMAINKIQKHALHELVDKSLGYESDFRVRRAMNAVAELAFQCLQSETDLRPTMVEVENELKRIQDEDFSDEKAEVIDISGFSDDVVLLKSGPLAPSPDSETLDCGIISPKPNAKTG